MVVLFSPELRPGAGGPRSGGPVPMLLPQTTQCPRRGPWEEGASHGEDAGTIPSLPALGPRGQGA